VLLRAQKTSQLSNVRGVSEKPEKATREKEVRRVTKTYNKRADISMSLLYDSQVALKGSGPVRGKKSRHTQVRGIREISARLSSVGGGNRRDILRGWENTEGETMR